MILPRLGDTAVEVKCAFKMLDIQKLASDFAHAIVAADAHRPTALSHRTGATYQSGIGPHTEAATLSLVAQELKLLQHSCYDQIVENVPYPQMPRQKCDWSIRAGQQTWFIEAKMMRLMGDNGKPNDNILTHILSPYPQQRSALTDCWKLKESGFNGRLGILIYGYSYQGYPLEPVIGAFEVLAREKCRLSPHAKASFSGLIHPVHREGTVYLWELLI
jgi:hypothetical protein